MDAVVVLGCRPRIGHDGRLEDGALARRVRAAWQLYTRCGRAQTVVVASGGKRWGDVVEADVMAEELAQKGVPRRALVRERCSLTTFDNARFASVILARRAAKSVAVVTCPFHVARAVAVFERMGVACHAVPSGPEPPVSTRFRLWRSARERVLLGFASLPSVTARGLARGSTDGW